MNKKIKHHIFCFLILIFFVVLAVGSTGTTQPNSYSSGHATVSDVFGAASDASTPFLAEATNSLKRQNDQFLRQVAMNLNYESNNYIRSLYNRSDYRNFSNDWYALRDRLYYQALQQNTSNYVKKELPYIFMDNDMIVVNKIGDIAHAMWIGDGKPDNSPSAPYKSLPGLR